LSQPLVEAAVNTTGLSDVDGREVTSQERIERNGHRPAILLIPDSVAGAAERALFEKGFQTIVLRENEVSFTALASFLSSLRAAALVVLVGVTGASAEMRRTLEAVAGDWPVDFVDVAPNFHRNKLLEEILSYAESLRVRTTTSFAGEDDQNAGVPKS
jgi:hypothetical protein